MKSITLSNIDRNLLQKQREFLWSLTASDDYDPTNEEEHDLIEGLIALTDAIADEMDGIKKKGNASPSAQYIWLQRTQDNGVRFVAAVGQDDEGLGPSDFACSTREEAIHCRDGSEWYGIEPDDDIVLCRIRVEVVSEWHKRVE